MSDPAVAVDPCRDLLVATGPEAEAYLQGQLSQDVAALPDGGFAWSWLLAPNGKVDALLRVTRLAADEWLLDTDAGWGDPVMARLNRFKLRTRVDVSRSPRSIVGWRGAGWEPTLPGGLATGVVLSPPWPGVEGADVVVDDPAAVGTAPAGDYEALRILAGMPRMGAEMDERTIPAETGLVPITVSFTKGCYTGQELVARIDSRGGNVPRRLRGLRSAATVETGAELTAPDGRAAGTVTSGAADPGGGGWIGLGYVRRAVDLPEVLTAGPGGPEVTQVALPL